MMETEVLQVDPSRPSATALRRAAAAIAAGGLVAFPTDTVYGIGCRADDAQAVEAVYRAKGRSRRLPLVLFIASPASLGRYAAGMTPALERAARQLWPGPLTVVVRARVAQGVYPEPAEGPPAVQAPTTRGRGKQARPAPSLHSEPAPSAARGQALSPPDGAPAALVSRGTIGLRVPRHPVALRLVEECGGALATTSANLSGHGATADPNEVLAQLRGKIALLLDAGRAPGGVESTVVDFSVNPPVVLRAGAIGPDELRAVIGRGGKGQRP